MSGARVAALVLAAGEGSRLGRPKAMVRIGGEPLVDRAVRTAVQAGCAPVLVVLGAAADQVVQTTSLASAVVVVNDGWQTGMGSSLRCGLSVLTDLDVAATVVLLVDQPGIGPEIVRRLVATWREGAPAVVASYGGQPRNPVVLDASLWREVAAMATGDQGARAWLRAHADVVTEVACDDLGNDVDIDTAEDLRTVDPDFVPGGD